MPFRAAQWKEMWGVMKFYAFIRPTPISKIGHNAITAFSYLGIHTMALVEIVTGLVMYDWLRQSTVLHPFVGWIPRLVSFPNLRLIRFLLCSSRLASFTCICACSSRERESVASWTAFLAAHDAGSKCTLQSVGGSNRPVSVLGCL